jgi:hypothetical protein
MHIRFTSAARRLKSRTRHSTNQVSGKAGAVQLRLRSLKKNGSASLQSPKLRESLDRVNSIGTLRRRYAHVVGACGSLS